MNSMFYQSNFFNQDISNSIQKTRCNCEYYSVNWQHEAKSYRYLLDMSILKETVQKWSLKNTNNKIIPE